MHESITIEEQERRAALREDRPVTLRPEDRIECQSCGSQMHDGWPCPNCGKTGYGS